MSKNEYDWRSILVMANKLDNIVSQNDSNKIKHRQLTIAIQDCSKKIEDLRSTINRCTAIYNDIKDNLTEKKKHSLDRYESAIDQAGRIVRNSSVEGAKLKYDGKRAIIVDKRQQSVNAREGGALRAVNGMMMRYSTMVAQEGVFPLVLLDETFFTLSDNTSVEMREYLQAFAEDFLIIAIEQHDTLFSGLSGVIKYNFVKLGEGDSKITREEPVIV